MSADPTMVAIELSGKFIELVIEVMELYPEEWSFAEGADNTKRFEDSRRLLKHKNGVILYIDYADQVKNMNNYEWECSITSPTFIPMTDAERKKLGAAASKLSKRLLLKSLGVDRLSEAAV